MGFGCPQDDPQVWFIRRIHRIHHIMILMRKIYYSKWIQSKISKGKSHMGLKRPGASFQASSARGVTHLTPQQCTVTTWVICWLPRSLLETQCPGLSLGSCYVGAFCLHIPKFQTPRRKTVVQCIILFVQQFRHSERFLVRLGENSSESSQIPAKGQLCKQAFQSIAVSSAYAVQADLYTDDFCNIICNSEKLEISGILIGKWIFKFSYIHSVNSQQQLPWKTAVCSWHAILQLKSQRCKVERKT